MTSDYAIIMRINNSDDYSGLAFLIFIVIAAYCMRTPCHSHIPLTHCAVPSYLSLAVVCPEAWMKTTLSHSTSKYENLESIQEKDAVGGGFAWRENEYKMNCTTLRPERQAAGCRILKRAASSSDCAPDLSGPTQPSLLRSRVQDGIGVRSDSYQNNLNLNGIAGQAVEPSKTAEIPKVLGKELTGKSAEPLHFLIVDDVLMNRRMVHRLLSSYNFQISEAKDGKDCMRVVDAVEAQGGKIDVVLMDNCMPIMTGEATGNYYCMRCTPSRSRAIAVLTVSTLSCVRQSRLILSVSIAEIIAHVHVSH